MADQRTARLACLALFGTMGAVPRRKNVPQFSCGCPPTRKFTLRESACVYITSGGEGFWGKNLSMLMNANPQTFARSRDTKSENYLFFQTTPFFCLLNVKQTKIRGYFIFGECKSAIF
jgi:hypothetical protein